MNSSPASAADRDAASPRDKLFYGSAAASRVSEIDTVWRSLRGPMLSRTVLYYVYYRVQVYMGLHTVAIAIYLVCLWQIPPTAGVMWPYDQIWPSINNAERAPRKSRRGHGRRCRRLMIYAGVIVRDWCPLVSLLRHHSMAS